LIWWIGPHSNPAYGVCHAYSNSPIVSCCVVYYCRYYKQSDLCPHCRSCPETFLHVMSCSHHEVADHRVNQQEILWTTLKKLRTPMEFLGYIQQGVTLGPSADSRNHPSIPPLSSSTESLSSASEATIRTSSSMAAEAFACQSTHIGWDNFLWGWIAKLWQDAYYQDCIEKQKWADKRDWLQSGTGCSTV